MHTSILLPPSRGFELKPVIHIVVAYQDHTAGQRARRTCDRLELALSNQCEFQESVWKLNLLRYPPLRDEATHDVADADLVVLSLRGDVVTNELKSWIESWLPQKQNHPAALVALLDAAHSENSEARTYLADAASRGQMTFFPGAADCDPSALALPKDKPLVNAHSHRHRPVPHWGINE